MNTEANILSIENLTTSYNGKPVLHELCLLLKKGEICCVIGEEGAGKSTLLKSITQQIKSKGEISYNGINVAKLTPNKMVRNGIDFIAQGGNILNGFTVEEHICLALSERSKTERSIVWKEIEQMFPNLITLKKQIAGRLSGGERIILSIACVLASDANFLVLDEPTAGLAPETCKVIGDFLLRMKNDRYKTIMLLEHNYDFAFGIADSVVTLKEGKLSAKYFSKDFKKPNFVDEKLYKTITS